MLQGLGLLGGRLWEFRVVLLEAVFERGPFRDPAPMSIGVWPSCSRFYTSPFRDPVGHRGWGQHGSLRVC